MITFSNAFWQCGIFFVNSCIILCSRLHRKLPSYVIPISCFRILELSSILALSHTILMAYATTHRIWNQSKTKQKTPKLAFPTLLIFKMFSSMGHIGMIFKSHVLDRKMGNRIVEWIRYVGHTVNFLISPLTVFALSFLPPSLPFLWLLFATTQRF